MFVFAIISFLTISSLNALSCSLNILFNSLNFPQCSLTSYTRLFQSNIHSKNTRNNKALISAERSIRIHNSKKKTEGTKSLHMILRRRFNDLNKQKRKIQSHTLLLSCFFLQHFGEGKNQNNLLCVFAFVIQTKARLGENNQLFFLVSYREAVSLQRREVYLPALSRYTHSRE